MDEAKQDKTMMQGAEEPWRNEEIAPDWRLYNVKVASEVAEQRDEEDVDAGHREASR